MLEIREDQLEAMRAGARIAMPEHLLRQLHGRGLEAHYQAEQRRVVCRDRRGYDTSVRFDERGLPDELALPSGERYAIELDEQGKLVEAQHSGGQSVVIERDEAARITAVAQRDDDAAATYRFGYDEEGRLAELIDPESRATRYDYDADGNLTSLISPSGARHTWERDEQGKLQVAIDPLGRQTRFDYEGGGLACITHPDGSTEELSYDEARGLAAVKLRDAYHVAHQLDPRGALSRSYWEDGTWVAYDWSPEGRLVGMRNRHGELRFDLDPRGDVLAEHSPQGCTRKQYDPEGRVTELVTPFGDRVAYQWDPDGRLSAVTDWEGRTTEFSYGPRGTVSAVRYGNGLLERQRYRGLRLAEATVSDDDGLKSRRLYTYDRSERMVEQRDATDPVAHRVERMEYDADGRLTRHEDVTAEVVRDYTYDAKGNLVRDGDTELTIGLMDEVRFYGDDEVDYDDQGNVDTWLGPRGKTRLRFNGAGQLTRLRVKDADGREQTWRYRYDALGRRTLKTDGTQVWRFGWSGHQLLWEEYQASPQSAPRRRDYLIVPDAVVPLAFREGGRTFWMQADARGAVTHVYDEDGRVVWQARYDAFGAITLEVNRLRQPFRLPGMYHDEESGLYHTLARYYAPQLKQFISRDPLWYRQGATNYSYARNDPYNQADPFGGFAFILGAVAAVAVGAAVGAVAAWATGGDPVAGAIEGGMATAGAIVGGLLGGPVGMIAGGMAGGAAGAFTGSLVEQARNGDPLCLGCAAEAAAVSLAFDAALLGLGRIPGVKRAVRAIGDRLHRAGEPLRDWAGRQVDRVFKRNKRAADNPPKKTDLDDTVEINPKTDPDATVTDDATVPQDKPTPEPGHKRVTKDLPPQTRAHIDKSPTLKRQLDELADDGWTVEVGPKGEGSYAHRGDKRIVIEDGQSPAQITQTLAHEAGHGKYGDLPHRYDHSMNKDAYVEANLKESLLDEGYAQMNGEAVRKEIIDNGGPDVGTSYKKYEEIYGRYDRGEIPFDQAQKEMGDFIGDLRPSTNPEVDYRTYYGEPWAENYDQSVVPWRQQNKIPEPPP